MSADTEYQWLETESKEGAVKRFSEFCKKDIAEQSKEDDFDLGKYQEAVQLLLKKLDRTQSVGEIFNAD